MVEYTCIRCGYTVKNKAYMRKHINKRLLCPPLVNDVSLEEEKKKYEIIEVDIEDLEFKCPCGKGYKSRQGLYFHNKVCTYNNDTNTQLSYNLEEKTKESLTDKERIRILELELEKLKNKSQSPSQIINNITNNNNQQHIIHNNQKHIINIKDFKYVDGEHIDGKTLIELIGKVRNTDFYYDVFQRVMQMIYFDKNHPELHTILVPNIKQPLCKILKDGVVSFENKNTVTEMAYPRNS